MVVKIKYCVPFHYAMMLKCFIRKSLIKQFAFKSEVKKKTSMHAVQYVIQVTNTRDD